MASPSPEIHPALAHFPPEVGAAYQRFLSQHDLAAVQVVVTAAVADLIPAARRSQVPPVPGDALGLIDDLGYDSLAIAEIVFFFEDLFQVKIATEDLRSIRTLGDLRAFVTARLAARTRSA